LDSEYLPHNTSEDWEPLSIIDVLPEFERVDLEIGFKRKPPLY
jgi:hypothetical protein